MFSYFKKGVNDTVPQKNIDLPQLIKYIKNNPQKELIETIRQLRSDGNGEYKNLKKSLSSVTPNCILRKRSLSDGAFNSNFISFSGYIYFDIDNVSDVVHYKKTFIEKHHANVAMVCTSSSLGGLSVLFKVSENINTKEEFIYAWNTIRNTILKDEVIDTNCSDIGRIMFISSDSDVYVNYENEISVDLTKNRVHKNSTPKRESQSTSSRGVYNSRVTYTCSKTSTKDKSIIAIKTILALIDTKTNVSVDNLFVDYKPVEYAVLFVPNVINDGTKHKIYTTLIHQIVYLNPGITKEYVFSYLWFVNNNNAKPKMETRELQRLCDSVYGTIINTGDIKPQTKIKNIHFNQKKFLTKSQKQRVANIINGYKKKQNTIEKIISAKTQLIDSGVKATQKDVARISGLSLKTVNTYFNSPPIDLDDVIRQLNDPANPIYIL